MSANVEKLMSTMQYAMKIRPKVGGFPYLAEALRASGVIKNTWSLPSCQSVYVTSEGNIVMQGTPLVNGPHDIPKFNQEALIQALRKDQAGNSTFPEFLDSTWKAGVVGYEVDFANRNVVYYSCLGEKYVESYPEVKLP